MGLLRGTSVYLIGAIDHAEDPRKWRREIAQDLLLPMGVRVYDPLVKPSWFSEGMLADDSYKEIKLFKKFLREPQDTFPEGCHENASSQEFRQKMHHLLIEGRMQEIRKLCLRMANNADFIIGRLPKKFTVGTLEELTVAANAGKPILLHLPDGYDTSTWLPAQMGVSSFFQNTFATMEELYDQLRSIDAGDTDVNNLEWVFLSYFNDKDVMNEFSSHQQARGQSS
jgi:hypothetical protein